MSIPWTYVLAWFPLVVLAVAIGVVRDATYGLRLDRSSTRKVSFGIAVVVFAGYTVGVVLLFPPGGASGAWIVGAIWVGLTLVFELPIRLLAPAPPVRTEPDPTKLDEPIPEEPIELGWPLLAWVGVLPWLCWLVLQSA